ncbi:toprim domain-containing protein [Brucella sp. TWI432]
MIGEDGKKIKLGFGPAKGGAVRLGPVTRTLRLAEGMETSLAVQRLTGNGASVWATLSTSGMIGFDIPDGVERLEIYADGDRYRSHRRTGDLVKPPGIAAAEALQAKAIMQNIEAVIYPSPEPDDWLDVWVSRFKDDHQQRNIEYRA